MNGFLDKASCMFRWLYDTTCIQLLADVFYEPLKERVCLRKKKKRIVENFWFSFLSFLTVKSQ